MPASLSSPSSSAYLPFSLRLILAGLLVGLLTLFLSTPTLAQQRRTTTTKSSGGGGGGAGYQTGIGIRAGSPTALSIKHFYKPSIAFEGLLGSTFGRHGLYAGLLVEKHGPAFSTPRLQWFYGLGAHASSYRGRYFYEYYHKGKVRYYDYYDERFWGVGIDGILGIEYHLGELPFTIGADIKPFVELVRSDGYFGLDGALTVRYAF